ncbi:hypothetical protein SDC9_103227 [bioreactor metagenome]|uniref:Uncharacterized protein n=1 Tax=bioreactor metagenome TaxID=1076179 RepID=A0A645B3X0_9ZZZZ
MPGYVIDVCPGSNTYTTNHSGKLIGDIVSVQVQRSYHSVFFGFQQCILQECVSNNVFNENFSVFHSLVICCNCFFQASFGFYFIENIFRENLISKFSFGECISPFFESSFGKLHDVPFVNQGNRWQFVPYSVLNG